MNLYTVHGYSKYSPLLMYHGLPVYTLLTLPSHFRNKEIKCKTVCLVSSNGTEGFSAPCRSEKEKEMLVISSEREVK